jgi:toxin ParE1/3/4
MQLELSRKAQGDIDQMHAYGRQFGAEQADAYAARLFDILDLLQLNPRMAVEIHGFKRKYRMLVYRSHLVFYRVGRGKIFVQRVLHHRMNWRAYL